MNKVELVGNICAEPEYGTTQNETAYCRFRVACQRRFKNANGVYESDFISCVAWRQTAVFVHNYFHKGSRIGVCGSLSTGSYTAQDGSKRYTVEVLADEVEFAGPKGEAQNAPAQPEKAPAANEDFTEVEDDELPF